MSLDEREKEDEEEEGMRPTEVFQVKMMLCVLSSLVSLSLFSPKKRNILWAPTFLFVLLQENPRDKTINKSMGAG